MQETVDLMIAEKLKQYEVIVNYLKSVKFELLHQTIDKKAEKSMVYDVKKG